MTEPARHLHPVPSNTDPSTGEFVECAGCHDKDILIEQLQGELGGKSMAIGKLKREVARVQGMEPDAEQVRWVLAYWRDRVKPKAKIVPGSERWSKVKARLKEGFTYEELMVAVDGALLSDFHRENGYLDAKTIFKEHDVVEGHRDRALAPDADKLYALAAIPREIAEHPEVQGVLIALCDCGCPLVVHSKADPFRDWRRPCLLCDCEDFDDTERMADEWAREYERRMRRERVREGLAA